MICFDINHPKYFTRQNETQQFLTRTIFILLAIHICWIILNFTFKIRKQKEKNNENYFEFTKMIKIPIIMFLFFISDEFERILLIFFYFLVVFLHNIYKPILKMKFLVSILFD